MGDTLPKSPPVLRRHSVPLIEANPCLVLVQSTLTAAPPLSRAGMFCSFICVFTLSENIINKSAATFVRTARRLGREQDWYEAHLDSGLISYSTQSITKPELGKSKRYTRSQGVVEIDNQVFRTMRSTHHTLLSHCSVRGNITEKLVCRGADLQCVWEAAWSRVTTVWWLGVPRPCPAPRNVT